MSILLSPALLFFLIVAVGWPLGKIKIGGISLGLAAVLLTAIGGGILLARLSPDTISSAFTQMLSELSALGTALFVSAVGLQAGLGIQKASKKEAFLAAWLGVSMVAMGFLASRLLQCYDATLSLSLSDGIFCGAMTSSPALASVCESGEDAIAATLGYGMAYPIGVITTVLWVQITARHATLNGECIKHFQKKKAGNASLLPIISGICVLGFGLGKCPLVGDLIGRTGSILLLSMIVGACLAKRCKAEPGASLSVYRTLGLLLFFVGNGISAGARLGDGISLHPFLYALIIALVPLIVGTLVCRFAWHRSFADTACLLAGGMTSTPALGTILEKKDVSPDLSLYSFSYIGALLAATLLPKIF